MVKNGELINALANCQVACENCYRACFDEPNIKKLEKCIRLDRDCADMCSLTMSFLARNSSEAETVVRTCAEICAACAEECEKHDHVHCKECADTCGDCEESCLAYLNKLADTEV